MINPLSKMNVLDLGLDNDLLEAAKKCSCKENDAYNPSGSGPANLPSEPNGSLPDAMTNKINIADEKKKKVKKEGSMDDMKPGYNKTIPEETERSFDSIKDARMSINQLKSVLHNTTELLSMIKPDDLLPEWVETKITLAEDYMVTCSNFLRSDRTK